MPGSGQTGGNPRVPNGRRCPPRMASSGVMARPLATPQTRRAAGVAIRRVADRRDLRYEWPGCAGGWARANSAAPRATRAPRATPSPGQCTVLEAGNPADRLQGPPQRTRVRTACQRHRVRPTPSAGRSRCGQGPRLRGTHWYLRYRGCARLAPVNWVDSPERHLEWQPDWPVQRRFR